MKWQIFQYAWLPIDKHKLYSYANMKTKRAVEPDQYSTDKPCLYEPKISKKTVHCLSKLCSNTTSKKKTGSSNIF